MTRPKIFDLDLVVVPRDGGATFSNSSLPKDMIDAGYDTLEQCDDDLRKNTGPDWDYGMQAVATFRAMLSASPYPTAWDDVRKYVEGLERLMVCGMAELAASNPNAMEYAKHWEGRAFAAEARIAELEKRLADARATGRREGMEEAAKIAEEPITYTFPDGSPAVTRPRPDGTTIAAAIRAAVEKKE